jgi:hypothetical protein
MAVGIIFWRKKRIVTTNLYATSLKNNTLLKASWAIARKESIQNCIKATLNRKKSVTNRNFRYLHLVNLNFVVDAKICYFLRPTGLSNKKLTSKMATKATNLINPSAGFLHFRFTPGC